MYEARKQKIVDLLEQDGQITVDALMKMFSVSHMTVRRDLAELERDGYLIRKHGGAVKSDTVNNLFSFSRRLEKNALHKENICRQAAEYINDGDTIFIDCGSTLYRICQYISRKKIRVITTSLPVVSELIAQINISVSLLGGEIMHERQAVYGPVTVRQIMEYSADKAFIGCDGLSVKSGLSAYDIYEAEVTRTILSRAREVFLLCDSSKVGKDSSYIFSPLSAVHHVITDSNISHEAAAELRAAGLSVITAK